MQNMLYFEQNPLYQNLLYAQNENLIYPFPNLPFTPNYFYPIHGIPILRYIPTSIPDNSNFENNNCPIKSENENTKTTRKKFSHEEDEQLKMLVNTMGCRKWDNIAKFMSGRTGRQCRDRYQNYLSPGYSSEKWTEEEDELLLCKYQEIGSKWSKMVVFFKKRNANALKNRWYYYLSKNRDKYNHEKKSVDNNIENHDDISGINSIIDYAFTLNFFDQINEKNDSNDKKA